MIHNILRPANSRNTTSGVFSGLTVLRRHEPKGLNNPKLRPPTMLGRPEWQLQVRNRVCTVIRSIRLASEKRLLLVDLST